ncbi:hypothetical protein AB0H07_39050 [Streptomyces sp. NPDC021354]|uniref:hypothetical protein n=1 Tax=Streptomyces sp. NPDC021354 TaxID=3154793 RepID=UPI00340CD730
MTSRTVWKIDVPFKAPHQGWHVFAGAADSADAAVAEAKRAHELAALCKAVGKDIPAGTTRRDWSARGYRPDRGLDWQRAQTKQIVL